MFKINNNRIQLNKSDKITLLNKVLSLQQLEHDGHNPSYNSNKIIKKMKEKLRLKEEENNQEDTFHQDIHEDIHEDMKVDEPSVKEEEPNTQTLSDTDAMLLHIFLNANNINTLHIWDNMTKKHKLLYNILRSGHSDSIPLDDLLYRYTYDDILFVQNIININNFALNTWEEATHTLKKFIDQLYDTYIQHKGTVTEEVEEEAEGEGGVEAEVEESDESYESDEDEDEDEDEEESEELEQVEKKVEDDGEEDVNESWESHDDSQDDYDNHDNVELDNYDENMFTSESDTESYESDTESYESDTESYESDT